MHNKNAFHTIYLISNSFIPVDNGSNQSLFHWTKSPRCRIVGFNIIRIWTFRQAVCNKKLYFHNENDNCNNLNSRIIVWLILIQRLELFNGWIHGLPFIVLLFEWEDHISCSEIKFNAKVQVEYTYNFPHRNFGKALIAPVFPIWFYQHRFHRSSHKFSKINYACLMLVAETMEIIDDSQRIIRKISNTNLHEHRSRNAQFSKSIETVPL